MLVLKQSVINEEPNLEMMKTVNMRWRNTITLTKSNIIINYQLQNLPASHETKTKRGQDFLYIQNECSLPHTTITVACVVIFQILNLPPPLGAVDPPVLVVPNPKSEKKKKRKK